MLLPLLVVFISATSSVQNYNPVSLMNNKFISPINQINRLQGSSIYSLTNFGNAPQVYFVIPRVSSSNRFTFMRREPERPSYFKPVHVNQLTQWQTHGQYNNNGNVQRIPPKYNQELKKTKNKRHRLLTKHWQQNDSNHINDNILCGKIMTYVHQCKHYDIDESNNFKQYNLNERRKQKSLKNVYAVALQANNDTHKHSITTTEVISSNVNNEMTKFVDFTTQTIDHLEVLLNNTNMRRNLVASATKKMPNEEANDHIGESFDGKTKQTQRKKSLLQELNTSKELETIGISESNDPSTEKSNISIGDFKSDIDSTTNSIPYRDNVPVTTNTFLEITNDNITLSRKVEKEKHPKPHIGVDEPTHQLDISINKSLGEYVVNDNIFDEFKIAVAKMEKQFYLTSYRLLSANSPESRRQNGISFVLSTVWLHMLLLLLSGEGDTSTLAQIDATTHFSKPLRDKDAVMKSMVASLPASSESLKLSWTCRLILGPGADVSEQFRMRANDTLGLHVHILNEDNATVLVETLNNMVQSDTSGALRGTFDESDLSGGVRALLLNTVYFRSRWRAPVTLLNGTRDFRDSPAPPHRQTRMFRVNDIVGYADVPEWDAEVLEIPYATANLSLVAVVPRSAQGLRAVTHSAVAEGLTGLVARLEQRRIAVSLPLFTLRMTLLLPNKLEAMGASELLRTANSTTNTEGLHLSHAVQRLMFWAEAGRNAYKDDGIEWDPKPEMFLVIDRPYFFMVRHNDMVLMTGNFVL